MLLLKKDSGEGQIKEYFEAVLKLKKSNEEFPVNLEEVYPLVYSRKEEAVRELKNSILFTEGVDYQLLRINAEQDSSKHGGHNKVTYVLSVSCMEYFIARKVRPVFDVYRKVFHQAVEQMALPNFTNPAEAAIAWAEEYKAKELAQGEVKVLTAENIDLREKVDVLEVRSSALSTIEAKETGRWKKLTDVPDSLLTMKQVADIVHIRGVIHSTATELYRFLRYKGELGGYPCRNVGEYRALHRKQDWNKPSKKLVDAGFYIVANGQTMVTSKGLVRIKELMTAYFNPSGGEGLFR